MIGDTGGINGTDGADTLELLLVGGAITATGAGVVIGVEVTVVGD